MDAAVSAVAFWACGYAFAYGRSENGFIGNSNYFLMDDEGEDFDAYVNWFFQVRCCRATDPLCRIAAPVSVLIVTQPFLLLCL